MCVCNNFLFVCLCVYACVYVYMRMCVCVCIVHNSLGGEGDAFILFYRLPPAGFLCLQFNYLFFVVSAVKT